MGPVVLVALVGLGLAMIGLVKRPRVDPKLAKDVEAYIGLSRLSTDEKRSEVTAFIDNKGTVPVDVTVRFRALDMAGHVAKEVISGPYRRTAPGSSKSIGVSIDTTPIDTWEIDIIELSPSPPPQ